MKRAIGLILLAAAMIVGFLSVRGTMPFLPILGASMEPQYQAGDLIMIEEVSPTDIEVGDIIVFSVPAMTRELYNYPPVVAHRVLRITSFQGAISFRTKGDNTGEDPFTVRIQDIRGRVTKHYSNLGFPLLFLQSSQGLVFVLVALCLLAFYLYGGEITRSRQVVHSKLFGPVIQENRRSNLVITRRIETSEKALEGTHLALQSFSEAMAEYAKHLQSHTSAIQGLSEASHELKTGAAEQTKILGGLVKSMQLTPTGVEPRFEPEEKPAVTEESVPSPAGVGEQAAPAREGEITGPFRGGYPPGCYRHPRESIKEETLTEKQEKLRKSSLPTRHTLATKEAIAGKVHIDTTT